MDQHHGQGNEYGFPEGVKYGQEIDLTTEHLDGQWIPGKYKVEIVNPKTGEISLSIPVKGSQGKRQVVIIKSEVLLNALKGK